MSEENVELTRRLLDAWSRRDVEAEDVLWDSEGVFLPALENLEGRTYRGHAGVRQYFEDLAEFAEEEQFEHPELRDLGDDVLGLGRVWFRLANGDELDQASAFLTTWRSGRCVKARVWIGPDAHADALEAAGLSE